MYTPREIQPQDKIQTAAYWMIDSMHRASRNQQAATTQEERRFWAQLKNLLKKITADILAQL